jgi:hypothetical protein
MSCTTGVRGQATVLAGAGDQASFVTRRSERIAADEDSKIDTPDFIGQRTSVLRRKSVI